MKFTIFTFTLLLFQFPFEEGLNDEKRLLLSDPQLMQSEIHALQQEVEYFRVLAKEFQAQKQENQALKTEVADLKQKFQLLESSSKKSGSIYTRWGKHSCPKLNGTELVYDGTAGGSYYSETGNGANTLCLPHDPELLPDHLPLTPSGFSHIYGGEYQFSLGKVVIQDDVPCSVCHVKMATSSMMIPAKRSCPTGWSKQYSGILTANSYGYDKSEYLCVDEDPDFVERSRQNEEGKLFYTVKTVCGSLPCPPYKNATVVSCVVCTM
ncbi:short-chain collagen C4-like [Saccostrea echinata]|uniref:short-chain collagen C4-like n=1 Tax=Saccostrea echinata TaxID=191078 RepID=UPI002A822EE4|nr:short-chain collagen C4-like [Saccostrea echinata]